MHYVYILKSQTRKIIYVGCSGDLRKRILEHNDNKVKSTKFKGPWELRYYEAFFSKSDAFNREKKLKQNYRGFQELKKRLSESLK